MTETLPRLLLRLSEGVSPTLWGRVAVRHFGREFDHLLAERVLVEEPPADTWSPCVGCDCGLDGRPIQRINGQIFAACPLDHRSDATLTENDLRNFRINVAALVRYIALASGLGQPDEILPAVWFLGRQPTGRTVFLANSLIGAGQPMFIDALKRSSRGAPITLLCPSDLTNTAVRRLEDTGVVIVRADDALGGDGFALDVSGLTCLTTDMYIAPRLIVVRSQNKVILDGRERIVPAQPYRLLLLLAETALARGGVLSIRGIEAHTGREARDVARELRDRLAEGCPDTEAARHLVRNSRSPSGYFLSLGSGEIEIRP
ncbi:MAG: hypothetical protein HQL34_00660 [Alphaproteobacteria bacterium]|nr:hypothetical protein [Alphaproteobacteria bacterium]